MKKQFLKDSLGQGFILWFIGYVLGIVLFSVVPISGVGWIIMPVGAVITLWVLFLLLRHLNLLRDIIS